MDIKLNKLRTALEKLRDKVPSNINPTIEMSIREEDFEKGVIGDVITIKMESTKEPNQYDNLKGKILVTDVLEIFPDRENRPAVLTTTERREF